ncbi:MAG: hypothetical protein AUF79_19045 [Crenarchaeota archaeon 13_1_20CM_2_51_8]|nr:MAG: hypothetical protein AUF79_19045 [Crenarchaeota archaeon 13_1_20CM_2_51_8]
MPFKGKSFYIKRCRMRSTRGTTLEKQFATEHRGFSLGDRQMQQEGLVKPEVQKKTIIYHLTHRG